MRFVLAVTWLLVGVQCVADEHVYQVSRGDVSPTFTFDVSRGELPPIKSVKSDKLPAGILGRVKFYTTNPCRYCEIQKSRFGIKVDPKGYAWTDSLVPFAWEIIDATKTKVPDYIDSFPAFSWDTPNGIRYTTGLKTNDEFVAIWKNSQKPVKAVSKRESNNYQMKWLIRSGESLPDHLRSTHGINPAGWTIDQMAREHDRQHEATRRGRR